MIRLLLTCVMVLTASTALADKPPFQPVDLFQMQWAERARMTEDLVYRRDGQGYLQPGYRQVFVAPTDGGAALVRIPGAPHNISWFDRHNGG